MAVLHLFDSSQCLHSGDEKLTYAKGVIMDEGKFRPNAMPVGGIVYLLDVIHEFKHEKADLVFCFDKQPYYTKNELHQKTFPDRGGYKGNRPRKPNYVSLREQSEMAMELLKLLGLNVVGIDGYEADDCIASLVQYYKNDYDKIYIHTRDSDLYYLVTDNVEIAKLGGSGKVVNLQNWEHTVKKDFIVPFNTLTISKMIKGESGDNIPSVTKEIADLIVQQLPQDQYYKCGDNTLLRQWLLKTTNNDIRTMAIFDLIAPIILPFDDVELHEQDFDEETFKMFAAEFGSWNYRYIKKSGFNDAGRELVEKYLDIHNGR